MYALMLIVKHVQYQQHVLHVMRIIDFKQTHVIVVVLELMLSLERILAQHAQPVAVGAVVQVYLKIAHYVKPILDVLLLLEQVFTIVWIAVLDIML
jgi:hypothetical protein